jgi:ATP-binding cassette subfamily B protein
MENKEQIRKYTDRQLFKKIGKYIKPALPKFMLAMFFVLVIVLLDLLPSILTGEVVKVLNNEEGIFKNVPWPKIELIGVVLLIYGLVLICACLINYYYQKLLQNIGQDLVYQVREDVFNHLERLSIGQLQKEPIGKLVTRVTNDTNALSELFTSVLVLLIKYLITIVAIYVVMWVTNVRLTAYISIVLPFIFISSFLFRKVSRKSYRNVRNNISQMNSYLSENISGMKVTQIFNQEEKTYNQ